MSTFRPCFLDIRQNTGSVLGPLLPSQAGSVPGELWLQELHELTALWVQHGLALNFANLEGLSF